MSRLPALQVVRGLAASLVVIDHAVLRQAEWTNYPNIVSVGARYSGALGVAVFFVLSGFIMIHTAGNTFGERGAARAFLSKRIIRIVPLYWLATLLEISLRLRKGGGFDSYDLLTSLFFVPKAVVPGEYMRPLLGVGWTLDYEMFFYCIFAVALLFKRNTGLWFLFQTLIGLVIFGAFFKPLADTSAPYTVLLFLTDPILLLFCAGVALGLVFSPEQKKDVVRHPVAISVTLLLVYSAVLLSTIKSYPTPLALQTATWICCILTVCLCLVGRQAEKTSAQKAGVVLGDISYSLYLFHFFAIVATEKIWWALFGPYPSPAFILAALAVSILCAYAIHHLVEIRITRFLTTVAHRKAGGRPSMPATESKIATDQITPS